MKKTTSLFLLITLSLSSFAQKNIDKIKVEKYYLYKDYIIQNNTIKGYFDFFSLDENPTISQAWIGGNAKKIVNWGVDISDENGNEINTFQFQEMKAIRLLEGAYSNDEICFQFANYKTKSFNFKIFNTQGKKNLDYSFELDNSEWRKLAAYNFMNETEAGNNTTLFDIKENGFFSIIPCEVGKFNSFKLLKFNTKENQKVQTFTYSAKSKMNYVSFLGAKDNVGYFKIQRAKGIMMKDILVNILAVDLNTLKVVFETNGEDLGEYIFDPTNLVEDPNYKSIQFLGTYYKNDDNIFKDESQGLALWELSPSGVLMREKYKNWNKDFNGFLGFNEKGKAKDFGFAFIHKTFQLKNNNIIAIGEGYRKQADAAGIATGVMSMALGGGVSSSGYTKMQVTDLVVFKFDENFNFLDGDKYSKNKNNFSMEGADFASAHLQAQIMKRFGAFDYNYTQLNEDRSDFVIFYTDCIRKNFFKENDYKHFFLRYSGNEVIKDEFAIKKEKKKDKKIFANQFQKILIWEYDQKEKKINNKIIKIK